MLVCGDSSPLLLAAEVKTCSTFFIAALNPSPIFSDLYKQQSRSVRDRVGYVDYKSLTPAT